MSNTRDLDKMLSLQDLTSNIMSEDRDSVRIDIKLGVEKTSELIARIKKYPEKHGSQLPGELLLGTCCKGDWIVTYSAPSDQTEFINYAREIVYLITTLVLDGYAPKVKSFYVLDEWRERKFVVSSEEYAALKTAFKY